MPDRKLCIQPIDEYACTLYTIALEHSYERDLVCVLITYSNLELTRSQARLIIDDSIKASQLLKRSVFQMPEDNRTLILTEKSAKLMLKYLVEVCNSHLKQRKINKSLADLVIDSKLDTEKKIHNIEMQTQGFDSDQLRNILFEIAAKTYESS